MLRVPAALHVVVAALLALGTFASTVLGIIEGGMPVPTIIPMLTFGAVLGGIYAAPGVTGWRAARPGALSGWRTPAAILTSLVSMAIVALVPWTFLFPGEPDGQTGLVVLVPIPSCLVAALVLLLLARRPVAGDDPSPPEDTKGPT